MQVENSRLAESTFSLENPTNSPHCFKKVQAVKSRYIKESQLFLHSHKVKVSLRQLKSWNVTEEGMGCQLYTLALNKCECRIRESSNRKWHKYIIQLRVQVGSKVFQRPYELNFYKYFTVNSNSALAICYDYLCDA